MLRAFGHSGSWGFLEKSKEMIVRIRSAVVEKNVPTSMNILNVFVILSICSPVSEVRS